MTVYHSIPWQYITINYDSKSEILSHHSIHMTMSFDTTHELMLFRFLSRTAVHDGGFSGKLDELEQATSFLHDNGTHTQLNAWSKED